MIIGCAGAGKSTLLKRLQKQDLNELKQVQSTIGLEVHEDIFEIDQESGCLKGKTYQNYICLSKLRMS
jgi:GTPase SAR1 family protein